MLHILIRMFFPQYKGKHHTTVRYAFSLVFVATIFAGLAAVISQNNSYISIKTGTAVVAQGQQFIIEVSAYAHVPINAVDVVLTYSQDSMVVDSVDTGKSVITLWTEEPYAKDGKIFMRGGTFKKGFVGEHPIARIKAHAVKSGDARILLKETQFIAGDGLGTIIPATNSKNGEIKISVISSSDGVLSAKASVSIITDTDGDGDVDLRDISLFMSAWFTKSNIYDFNKDGKVNLVDFSILLADSIFN